MAFLFGCTEAARHHRIYGRFATGPPFPTHFPAHWGCLRFRHAPCSWKAQPRQPKHKWKLRPTQTFCLPLRSPRPLGLRSGEGVLTSAPDHQLPCTFANLWNWVPDWPFLGQNSYVIPLGKAQLWLGAIGLLPSAGSTAGRGRSRPTQTKSPWAREHPKLPGNGWFPGWRKCSPANC